MPTPTAAAAASDDASTTRARFQTELARARAAQDRARATLARTCATIRTARAALAAIDAAAPMPIPSRTERLREAAVPYGGGTETAACPSCGYPYHGDERPAPLCPVCSGAVCGACPNHPRDCTCPPDEG